MGPAVVRAEAAKIAVLPTHFDASAKDKIPQSVFEEALLGAAQDASHAKVIGADDLSAVIGLENQRDLLGCDELACMAEIAGALDVQQILSAKVALLDSQWTITIKLIYVAGTPEVLARVTEFVPGGPSDLLKALPGVTRSLFAASASSVNLNDAEPETTTTDLEKKKGKTQPPQEVGMFAVDAIAGTTSTADWGTYGGDLGAGVGLRGPIIGLLGWRARVAFEILFDSDRNTLGAIYAEAGIRFRPFGGVFAVGLGGYSAPIFMLSRSDLGDDYPTAMVTFGAAGELIWAYGDNDENEIGARVRANPYVLDEGVAGISVLFCMSWGL